MKQLPSSRVEFVRIFKAGIHSTTLDVCVLSRLGLPVGLEAPAMTPKGVNFVSFFVHSLWHGCFWGGGGAI